MSRIGRFRFNGDGTGHCEQDWQGWIQWEPFHGSESGVVEQAVTTGSLMELGNPEIQGMLLLLGGPCCAPEPPPRAPGLITGVGGQR